MKEIITVNGVKYTVENIKTGIDTISFKVVDPLPDDVEAAFRNVKELTVEDTEGAVYGEYFDIEYKSITINADGAITVTMHIPTKTEKQIRNLQEVVAEHDEAIAAIMFGGEAK